MVKSSRFGNKFRDMRIKPPKEEGEEPEPEDRICEMPNCHEKATHKALKHQDGSREFHWFCVPHMQEYNKGYNYFEGMNEGQSAKARDHLAYGERKTWNWASVAHQPHAKLNKAAFKGHYRDIYGILNRGKGAPATVKSKTFRLSRMQLLALQDLSLEENATKEDIKQRYKDLVKKFHPDANGGDISAREDLARVIKAYNVLKAAGLT